MVFEKINSISLQGNNRSCPAAKIFGNALKSIVGVKKQDRIINQCLRQKSSTSKGAVSGSPVSLERKTKIFSQMSNESTNNEPIDHSYQGEDNSKFQHHDLLSTSKPVCVAPGHNNITSDEASNDIFPQCTVRDCKKELASKRETTINSNCLKISLSESHNVQSEFTKNNNVMELGQSYCKVSLADSFNAANYSKRITNCEKNIRTDNSFDFVHKEANLQAILQSENQITGFVNDNMHPHFLMSSDHFSLQCTTNAGYKDNIASNSKMTTPLNAHTLRFSEAINDSAPSLQYFSPQYFDTGYQDNKLYKGLSKMYDTNLNLSLSTNAAETSTQRFYQSVSSYKSNIAIPSELQPFYLNDLVSSQALISSSEDAYKLEDNIIPDATVVEDVLPLESVKYGEVSQNYDPFQLLTKCGQSSNETESIFTEPSFYASLNSDKPHTSFKISHYSVKPFTDRFIDSDTDELSSCSEEEMLENKEIDNFNSGTEPKNLDEKSPALEVFHAERNSLNENTTNVSEESNVMQSFLTEKAMEFSPVTANCSTNKRDSSLPEYPVQRLLTFRSPGFIDSHCHIDLILRRNNFIGSYADFRNEHLSEFPINYKGCVAVFCYPETFHKKYMWRKHLKEENVWASFGCHPKRSDSYNDYVEKALCEALEHPQVRALGEIGLDYSNGNNCLVNVQQRVFMRQIQIAINKNLPLVIHCRDAYEDCLHIMKLMVPKDYKIHMHCFKATWEWAEKFMEEFPNLCIGITNVVTFPDAKLVHEVAKKIPLNRLLLETDAPYFVPNVLSKGTIWAHPGMAIHVAAQITCLRGITLREVLHHTLQNTKQIYGV